MNGNNQGGCGIPQNYPVVQFMQAQPQQVCPSPGVERTNSDTVGRQYTNPRKSCRLEFDDIVGNTTVDSLLVLGNRECFTDAELRVIFGVGEATPIIEPDENCRIENTVIEGTFVFTATGTTADIAAAQFRTNAQQVLTGVINDPDCPFKFRRDMICSPCEDGELIQSYGSGQNCTTVVVGREAIFALVVRAGATLEDVAFCICAYELPNIVSCRAPEVCPEPPPAPPVCPPSFGVPTQQAFAQNVLPFNGR